MKTHDLAKALNQLAKFLRTLPNQNVGELGMAMSSSSEDSSLDVGINLSALASLSKFSKSDWEKTARDFEIPVEIRPRDAARDVMGKILTYLADNKAEQERVAMKSRVTTTEPSELTSALKFLMNNG